MPKRRRQEGTSLIPSNLHVPEDCRAVSEVLARVGDKWTVLVVSTLGEGPKRFNELRRALGSISQRMLTLTLRSLERDEMEGQLFPCRICDRLGELAIDGFAPVAADQNGDLDLRHVGVPWL